MTDVLKLIPTLQAMEEHGIVLCIHGGCPPAAHRR
eukprot:SAG11_NODE_5371_length_1580_cov_3.199865_2_plen_34_part_01